MELGSEAVSESGAQTPPPAPARPARTPRAQAGDLAVAIALLAVLLFGPAAYLMAGASALAPRQSTPPLAPVDGHPNVPVRTVPAGLPSGFQADTPDDLAALAGRALGPSGAATLLQLLSVNQDDVAAVGYVDLAETAVGGGPQHTPYPYRYPALTRLLDQAPGQGRTAAAATLGSALLMLSARYGGGEFDDVAYPNAAPAAFAVLDRARTGRQDCDAQLNLLALVSADDQPRNAPVQAEAGRAETACPGDPTPGWLLVQYQSQIAATVPSAVLGGDPIAANAKAQALTSANRLDAEFSGSAQVMSTVADVQLRNGLVLQKEGEAFTARAALRAAAADYTQARSHGDPEAQAGLARALVALGEPDQAVALARSIPVIRPRTPGPLLELATTAQEGAHQFGAAQRTAHTLAARGATAYPGTSALFADPYGDNTQDGIQDSSGPQSTGTSTLEPFSVTLQPSGGAGDTVDDFSFIPPFRADDRLLALDPSCAEGSWRRDAILAGHPLQALSGASAAASANFSDARTGQNACTLSNTNVIDMARLEAGLSVSGDQNALADERQNMWRWAGNLPRAEQVIRQWITRAGPAASLPVLRLGEVEFLQKRYDDAAESFGVAARRTRQAQYNADLFVDQALLDRDAALVQAGRTAEGIPQLRSLAENGELGEAYQRVAVKSGDGPEDSAQFAAVAYHAHALLADSERESGELRAAVEDYGAARDIEPYTRVDLPPTGLQPERIDANEAVTQLALGRVRDAAQEIHQALTTDPMDPAFLMTAGFVADRAGQRATAIADDRAALASDPGAFPAANDLGVELARQGHLDQATTALRQAVGARPDYALAWFNLGVVYARRGPATVLQSQGAFAHAFRLDGTLRDRSRRLTIDASTYRTGLDLSRPLPPDWSLAGLQNLTPVPSAGLLALLLLALGLARAAGGGARSGLAGDWLESAVRRLDSVSWLKRGRSPAWALAVSAAVFAVPALVHGSRAVSDMLLVSVGVIVLGLAAMRSRALLAWRAGAPIRQESWGPGLAFGLVTSVIAPWAPLPVARDADRPVPRLHTVAPVLLALTGVVLFVEAAALPVPAVRSLAEAALVMVASVLVPVEPLDGAKISKTSLLAGLGVLVAALLVGLGVL